MFTYPNIIINRKSKWRNGFGCQRGPFSIYKALSIATGQMSENHVPNLENTEPFFNPTPNKNWKNISSFHPYGHSQTPKYSYNEPHDNKLHYLNISSSPEKPKNLVKNNKGSIETNPIEPTIAITKAKLNIPEIDNLISKGELTPDGKILEEDGSINVIECAIEPVWNLPKMSEKLNINEEKLRQNLYTHTNGMYPEFIQRFDLPFFLPPIPGTTIYIIGNPDTIPDPNIKLTVRVHDECNGSDVFGSDICTCRPYLMHGIEEAVKTAQEGGNGLIVYFRKEGRALGEVIKYLVYNKRKRLEEGDNSDKYFQCTELVAGVEDARFQCLMPEPLIWLGVKKIDKLVSMSNLKYDAIIEAGIKVGERITIKEELIPKDAHVEIDAKIKNGYNTDKI